MATERENFSGQTTPHIIDTVYRNCNFSQPQPVDVGGLKQGVRLFPGNNTLRTFIECNLVNCEPPPGSVLVQCNTTVRELGTADAEGDVYATLYGHIDNATLAYVYRPTPTVVLDTPKKPETFFVDSVRGNDGNDGRSEDTAFRGRGHALSVTRSRDHILEVVQ